MTGLKAERGQVGTAKEICNSSPWKAACCFFSGPLRYSFHNGICSEKKKYLGDECGDGWGICRNDRNRLPSHEYDYQVSCYAENESELPRCIPAATRKTERWVACSCALPTLICAAEGDTCNGHPCVFSTSSSAPGPGNHYCDFQSGNGW